MDDAYICRMLRSVHDFYALTGAQQMKILTEAAARIEGMPAATAGEAWRIAELEEALVHVTMGMHATPQYMLMEGLSYSVGGRYEVTYKLPSNGKKVTASISYDSVHPQEAALHPAAAQEEGEHKPWCAVFLPRPAEASESCDCGAGTRRPPTRGDHE